MFFIALVLFSSFLIEGIGTYISILGLSALFSANPIVITMAIALDLAKIVTVSFLYKNWMKLNIFMRTYMTVAAIILVLITSMGAIGFLSGEFQHAILKTNQQSIVLDAITAEQTRLQARKTEIDTQIAQVSENNIRGKTQLIRNFDQEVRRINNRLNEIDKQLPELKIDSVKQQVEVGPIIYIAEAFGTTPEKAVKWVILIIVFVFDPLAISLLVAANMLLNHKKDEKAVNVADALYEVNAPPMPYVPSVKPDDINLTEFVSNVETDKPALNLDIEIPKPVEVLSLVEITPVKTAIEEGIQFDEPDLSKLEVPEIQLNELAPTKLETPVIKEITEPVLSNIEIEKTDIQELVSELPEREVITIEQITAPFKRSSLEDVNDKHGDVEPDNENRRSIRHIMSIYENGDTAK